MALDQSFFPGDGGPHPQGEGPHPVRPLSHRLYARGQSADGPVHLAHRRHAGGTFILRIEDTDQGRLVEGATDVIYRTMAECGLTHDEGPT